MKPSSCIKALPMITLITDIFIIFIFPSNEMFEGKRMRQIGFIFFTNNLCLKCAVVFVYDCDSNTRTHMKTFTLIGANSDHRVVLCFSSEVKVDLC